MTGTVAVAEVEEALKKNFSSIEHLEIVDISDTCPGAKFELVIVSKDFDGKPLLDRHRMVNDSVKPLMSRIHALTMKTWTPQQYEQRKQT
eukprot:TRINITY_DN5743_c0_g1_i1.p1 TRINITY_DN5743_c0_g1~~TRINITY_DN5743_c0_g1_i1.p1  ORF type:complete len:101 (-),score=21.62 TRINITY_DN5743_c0_g1_i1:50-319(-)